MQGNILQALALVSVGNAALRGREIVGFWPGSLVFRWSKQVEFVIPRGGDAYDQVAADPLAWFAYLKASRCRGLRLHNAPMRQAPRLGHMEERMLVGFVGGGPRWLIEAVGAERSQHWEGFDRIGDRKDPERRIWLTGYLMQGETVPQDDADHDVSAAASEVRAALMGIEPLAREIGAANFAEIFASARKTLDEGGETFDFAALTDLTAEATRLLLAASEAWVFGGMGSWNDVGTDETHAARYAETSETLFRSLQRAVIAVANSSYRGSRPISSSA